MTLPTHPWVVKLREYLSTRAKGAYELPEQIIAKLENEFRVEKQSAVRDLFVAQLDDLAEESRRRGLRPLAKQLKELTVRLAARQTTRVSRDTQQAKDQAKAQSVQRFRSIMSADGAGPPVVSTKTKRPGTGQRAADLVPRIIRG